MKRSTALASLLLATTAVLCLSVGNAAATTTPVEVREQGAHCTSQNGNHWAWDVHLFPGSAVTSYSVEAPWTVQNVDGPNANERLILHLVTSTPLDSWPASVSVGVNGTATSVTPTLSQGPETQGGNAPQCPQPPVVTTTTTLPPTTTTTEPTTSTSIPSNVTVVPSSRSVNPCEKDGTCSDVPHQPVVLDKTSAVRASLPNTGMSGSDLLWLLSAGVAFVSAGIATLRKQQSMPASKTKRGLQ